MLLSPEASRVMEASPLGRYANENVYVSWASSGCLGSAYRASVISERYLKGRVVKVLFQKNLVHSSSSLDIRNCCSVQVPLVHA